MIDITKAYVIPDVCENLSLDFGRYGRINSINKELITTRQGRVVISYRVWIDGDKKNQPMIDIISGHFSPGHSRWRYRHMGRRRLISLVSMVQAACFADLDELEQIRLMRGLVDSEEYSGHIIRATKSEVVKRYLFEHWSRI